MDLHITLGSGEHTAAIYRQLLDAILDGRLPPDERLPSSRELATRLRVARGTVGSAYERLVAEGFLVTRAGSGTFVSGDVVAHHRPRTPGRGTARPTAIWQRIAPAVPDPADPVPYDLSFGGPDPALFPLAGWRRVVSNALRPSLVRTPVYADPGHPALQRELARQLGLSRSVRASGEDIVLTNGAQQGLDLCARALIEPDDVVAIEDPGYTAGISLFASYRASVRGVPVDRDGVVVDQLPDNAKIIYVTPSHQYPTGAVMSLQRRLALLQWADDHGALIIEDDYDSEYRYADRPLEPLQSLDEHGRVIYLGSFSKTLHPMLRLGYLVAPTPLQPALRRAKQLTDWQGDFVTQQAMSQFLAEGQLAAHTRRARRSYRDRRDILLAELDQLRPLEVLPSVAGLHVCARFRDPEVDAREVERRAAEMGVRVSAIARCFHEYEPWPGLALGFSRITAANIPGAVGLLGRVLGSAD